VIFLLDKKCYNMSKKNNEDFQKRVQKQTEDFLAAYAAHEEAERYRMARARVFAVLRTLPPGETFNFIQPSSSSSNMAFISVSKTPEMFLVRCGSAYPPSIYANSFVTHKAEPNPCSGLIWSGAEIFCETADEAADRFIEAYQADCDPDWQEKIGHLIVKIFDINFNN
jgi:hypothetical protein